MAEITKLLAGIVVSLQALLGVSSASMNDPSITTPVFSYATTTVSIGETQIQVKIADTDAKREQGLSGTTLLTDSEGMLFIFPQSDRYKFWMKDMNYPLDIIWFDSNGKIVYIGQNLAPSTYPQTFVPNQPAQYVLEIKAGNSEKYHLRIGGTIKLNKN